MADDRAELRALADSLTVPTIADAPVGTRVACTYKGEEFAWVSLDAWWSPEGPAEDDASDGELEEFGATVTHVSVPVETVEALRAALPELLDAADERDRLTAVLHARQCHPDYSYSMTFAGSQAHTSREGWEPNPHAVATARLNPPRVELYWMRRKAADRG